ncbi:hypothetical protein ABE527_02630 [Brucella sp. TWI432]
MSVVNTFRIYYGDFNEDVQAETPTEARKLFLERRPKTIIKKIKLVRGDTK